MGQLTPVRRFDVDSLLHEEQVPPSRTPSGSFRRVSIEELRADLASMRPIAKTRPPERVKREALNAPALERFRWGVDTLRMRGWSRDHIARHLGCTLQTLSDVYEGHRYVSAWMLDALPDVQVELAELRCEQLKRGA